MFKRPNSVWLIEFLCLSLAVKMLYLFRVLFWDGIIFALKRILTCRNSKKKFMVTRIWECLWLMWDMEKLSKKLPGSSQNIPHLVKLLKMMPTILNFILFTQKTYVSSNPWAIPNFFIASFLYTSLLEYVPKVLFNWATNWLPITQQK